MKRSVALLPSIIDDASFRTWAESGQWVQCVLSSDLRNGTYRGIRVTVIFYERID